ncbi:MAG: HD-GYP domain [Rhodospirillaceae bacterium]|nr:MAG: HD-GYP domain [Rhodospirillaceae bacterium]
MILLQRETAIDSQDRLRRLIDLGIALSAERELDRLLERILLEAKDLANADGGTLYLYKKDESLVFIIVRSDILGIALGGMTGRAVPFLLLRLRDPETGQPNYHSVATHTALRRTTVIIEDTYDTMDFNFSGAKKFNASTDCRSKSFLTVPLKNYQGDVIGVLQLINACDGNECIIPFLPENCALVEALASQAAVAIDNQQLIEAQRRLLEAFIQVIAHAIDAKSLYTGGHCAARVPVLTRMLAEAAHASQEEPFVDFALTTEVQRYELHLAVWLHDCGKVTMPEYVRPLDSWYDYLIGSCNLGEVYNLSISRGAPTNEERTIINDHITLTIEMLEKLPFPRYLKNILEFAGAHHEKMDRSGYPRGLRRKQMSIPARIMAIADIFEAPTAAADRPYKKPKTLSESI